MTEKKNKEKLVITIVIIAMSLVMGVIASIIIYNNPRSNTPALPVFMLTNLFETAAAGIIISQLVPFVSMGKKITDKTGARAPEIKYIAILSAEITVISVLVIEFILCLVNIIMARSSIPAGQAPPFVPMFLTSFLPLLLPSLAACYVVAVIVFIVVYKVMGIGKKADKTD